MDLDELEPEHIEEDIVELCLESDAVVCSVESFIKHVLHFMAPQFLELRLRIDELWSNSELTLIKCTMLRRLKELYMELI